MPVGTVKSAMVTAFEAKPQNLAQISRNNHRHIVVDKIAITSTAMDDVGDVILLAPIESNAKVFRLGFLNDALAASGLAYNIGLYYSGIGGEQLKQGKTSGTVIDADCIATAAAFSSARVVLGDLRFEADDIVNIDKEAWEIAGLTSDPGGHFYIGLTCSTVATTPAAGDIVVVVEAI